MSCGSFLLSAIGSMLNAQSNALVTALMVGGWTAPGTEQAPGIVAVHRAVRIRETFRRARAPALPAVPRTAEAGGIHGHVGLLAGRRAACFCFGEALIFLYGSWYRMCCPERPGHEARAFRDGLAEDAASSCDSRRNTSCFFAAAVLVLGAHDSMGRTSIRSVQAAGDGVGADLGGYVQPPG